MLILHNPYDKESRQAVADNPDADVIDWYGDADAREKYLAAGGTAPSKFPTILDAVPPRIVHRTPMALLALIPEDERRTLFRALESLASQTTAAGNTARDFLDFWRAAREIDVTGNEQIGGGITWPQAVGYMLNQGWISQATHDALRSDQ